MRLDKYLADLGYGTRKEVKKILQKQNVTVNGKKVVDSKFQVSSTDEICLNGEVLVYEEMVYLLYHKPKGCICSKEVGLYPTIYEWIDHPQIKQLFSVGRLDVDTTGAILITNDGKLDYQLRSIKNHVNKVYEVTLKNKFDEYFIPLVTQGITLEDGTICAPAQIQKIDDFHVRLTLQEGKYHQVKRMMIACENEVVALHRSHFSFLDLKDLEEGMYRKLSEDEIRRLKR